MRAVASVIAAFAFALSAFAQAPPTKFDAVSIKPAAPPSGQKIRIGVSTDPGRLTATNMSLRDLIQAAYALKPYQVVGPAWLATERFDVSGETTAPAPRDQMAALLRPFLESQFKLLTHRETKTLPIYALLNAAAQTKLKPANAGPLDGSTTIFVGPQGMHLTGTSTMDDLANMLSRQEDRPVINQTGLPGLYQIDLVFAPTGNGALRLGSGLPAKGDDVAPHSTDSSAPNLFTALQEQLGLKLKPSKGPIEILVIDSASKSPVGNL